MKDRRKSKAKPDYSIVKYIYTELVVYYVRVKPANCGSDHYVVTGKIVCLI